MKVLKAILAVIFGIGLFFLACGCSTSEDGVEETSENDDENSNVSDVEDVEDIEDDSSESTTEKENKNDKNNKGSDVDADSDTDSDTDMDADTDSDAEGISEIPDDFEDNDTSDIDTSGLEKFSFFVTSLAVLRELSGNQLGFGGDLRYGETGPGAGLRGADKICATIAEKSMPGSSVKKWRAFLSATDDGKGKPVHAIDRVGTGPWYDRAGRVLALTKEDLLFERPRNSDPAIRNDLPNEDGVPNHAPNGQLVDNHDFLTGTNAMGQLFGLKATCLDWTSAENKPAQTGRPRVGHTWGMMGAAPGAPTGGNMGGSMSGMGSMNNWMSALTESGCAPGVNLQQTGGPQYNAATVGSGGGYGGFYCFALVP